MSSTGSPLVAPLFPPPNPHRRQDLLCLQLFNTRTLLRDGRSTFDTFVFLLSNADCQEGTHEALASASSVWTCSWSLELIVPLFAHTTTGPAFLPFLPPLTFLPSPYFHLARPRKTYSACSFPLPAVATVH